jgi:hypothetical protein
MTATVRTVPENELHEKKKPESSLTKLRSQDEEAEAQVQEGEPDMSGDGTSSAAPSR